MSSILMISSEDIKKVLTFNKLIPAMEKCLKSFSTGPKSPVGAIQPLRSRIEVEQHNGLMLVMPGYLPESGALATKIVSLYPNNAKEGKSTHTATVVLMNSMDGTVKAFLDGEPITELRTAAASGVASKYLAPESVKKICVLGSGTQGASHARVHHFLYKPCQISIWSRSFSNAQKLASTLRAEGLDASAAATVAEATEGADIINTCTLAQEPILMYKHVKEGIHINAVGAACPQWQELDPEIMKSSILYCDSREAASVESGDVIHSGAEIYAEIGEVLGGKLPKKTGVSTVYKSLGMAVMDCAAADLAFNLLNN